MTDTHGNDRNEETSASGDETAERERAERERREIEADEREIDEDAERADRARAAENPDAHRDEEPFVNE